MSALEKRLALLEAKHAQQPSDAAQIQIVTMDCLSLKHTGKLWTPADGGNPTHIVIVGRDGSVLNAMEQKRNQLLAEV